MRKTISRKKAPKAQVEKLGDKEFQYVTGPPLPVYDIKACGRCGQAHPELKFKPFAQPMKLLGLTFTHWGTCPNIGEPILLFIVVSPVESHATRTT